jgi:hypothetical protein
MTRRAVSQSEAWQKIRRDWLVSRGVLATMTKGRRPDLRRVLEGREEGGAT